MKVEIRCPSCLKIGYIDFQEEYVKQNLRGGLTAINVGKNQICPHSFIIYIDNNLSVRDYILADYQIEIPKLDMVQKGEENEILDSSFIDVSLIKANIYPIILTYIIRGCFIKKKMMIISDDLYLNKHINNFFTYITTKSFKLIISLISKEFYNANKKEYKEYIIFDRKNIIKEDKKTEILKKAKVEKEIVKNFFAEFDPNTSLIILKNEFLKAYILSNSIANFLKNLKKDEKLNITKITEFLKIKHNFTVSTEYLNFLIDIVKNYFEIDIPIIYDSFVGFL